MSILRYGLTARSYTATGANYDVDRPAANVASLDVPQRLARSIDTSNGDIILDLGGSAVVPAFSVDDVNFAALEIFSGGSSGGPWTSEGTFIPALEGLTGRLKALCLTPTFSAPFARLSPSAPAGSTYDWGGVGAWTDFVEVPFTVSLPYGRRVETKSERTDYGNGVFEIGVPGRAYTVLTFQGGYAMLDEDSVRAAYQALARLPENQVMVWWEELFGTQSMYHMRRTASVNFHIDSNLTELIDGFQLTEVC